MNRIALTTATLICLLVSANVIAPTKAWYDCDVNNDGKVDGKDLALVVKRYNTYQNSTFWDPRCDLNLDLKVDGRDIAIFAKYFGRILFPRYIMPSMFNDLDPWLKNPDIHFDAEGIPTVEYGWMIEYQYNPVTIEEYALALYHQYLSTGNESYSRQFMIQANWLVRNVNTTGNWSVWLYKFD
ncbi:MAG TPA: dockerin type I domain-containing protein [Candidatus Acidoferrum sp.]|nr:dockerin type I domain-containing protein [Candidatus Acidoferrum sp.]